MYKKGSILVISGIILALVLIAGASWVFLFSDNLNQDTGENMLAATSNSSLEESKIAFSNNPSLKNETGFSDSNNLSNISSNKIGNNSLCNGSNLAIGFNTTNGSCGCLRVIDFEKYSYEVEGSGTGGSGISKYWILENKVKRIVYSESMLGGVSARYWTISENRETASYTSNGDVCVLVKKEDEMVDDSENIYGHNPLESVYLLDYAFYIKNYVRDEKVVFKGQEALKMTASHLSYMDKAKIGLGGDAEISLDYFSTKFCVPLQMETFIEGDSFKTSFFNISVENIDESVFIPPTGCIEPLTAFS
jgi:hypothetical protein